MAIAYDASANGTALPDTTCTWSHTCTGSNRLLIVVITSAGGYEDVITGVTYNSVAMTRVPSVGYVYDAGSQNRAVFMYYLIAPSTGANNVVVSASSARYLRCASASYTGVKQSGFPDGSNSNSNSGDESATSVTTSVTTGDDNCWNISGLMSYQPVASTGVTERQNVNNYCGLGDSNGAKTPPGSYSMTWTNSTPQWDGAIQVSIAPNIDVTTNQLKIFVIIG